MAQLAIRGHATRGKEVIEILEMLGGENEYKLNGCNIECAYYKKNGVIYNTSPVCLNNIKLLTLENFLEKFPYKVGDKVHNIIHNENQTITDLVWEEGEVLYQTNNNEYVYVNYLQPYKEETMEERKYSELRMPLDDDDKLATEVTIDGDKITPPYNHLIGKITKVDNGMLVEFVKKQPQYPKTYEECCKIIHSDPNFYIDTHLYSNKLELLYKLIICRDAYWKIAGDWKPDYMYCDLYCIGYDGNVITWKMQGGCRLLAFPTEEMRDAFYENFKELIELVKELL